jgi:hypothetical protein
MLWYRGQANKDHQLIPSLSRSPAYPNAEGSLLKRFKQNAVQYVQIPPESEWEWLFLMLHYRVPTRLLDWSESPLVGLYFAVDEHPERDGSLWCLDPIALNVHANIKFDHSMEIPAFGHDKVTENYLPSSIAGETTSDLFPIAVIGPRNSRRIAAQLGTFTITHRTHTPIEDVGDRRHVWRLIIPAESKAAIWAELSCLRCVSLTLFPELERVADDVREVLP